MVTYALTDYLFGTQHTIRQAHGVFTRLAPVEPLVILAEADAYITTSDTTSGGMGGTSPSFVSALQADVEPTQGLHIVVTGETMVQGNSPMGGTAASYGAWTGLLWFFAPHADARFDFVASSIGGGPVTIYLLPQLHLYL
jgi:hypothetical protein